jgi:UDP-N-acetylmuramoylalanine--D-glutamate ligase
LACRVDWDGTTGHPAAVGSSADNGAVLPIEEPVAVLGAGVEGRATIGYLIRRGVTRITALDRQVVEGLPDGITTVFGEGYDQGLDRFATVFRSPGIRPDRPEVLRAAAAGARVTSAVSHFLERCPAARVVGVTGTVGKGTTASLTASLLESAGYQTHLGGNIGLSPLEFLDEVQPSHAVVLEISSFQAMDISCSPPIAVILKTTSEHLDWHRDVDEYRGSKAMLVSRQRAGDRVVVNADSPGALEIAQHSPAARLAFSLEGEVEHGLELDDDGFLLRLEGGEQRLPLDIRRVRLPGRFNLENVAASLLAAVVAGAAPEAICNAAERFAGLPHRLELIAEAGGLRFVNDSYATRPEATIAAITAFGDEQLALILGGSEKHADFGPLADRLASNTRIAHIGLIGETALRLGRIIEERRTTGPAAVSFADLERAVAASAAALPAGGVVLLSPACASFGMFSNYKVRGERFRAIAKALADELKASSFG